MTRRHRDPSLRLVQPPSAAHEEKNMAKKPDNDIRQTVPPIRPVDIGPAVFVVRVPDDAMRPAFRAGDVAYVDPDVPVAPGAFVCVRVDGTSKTVRLYAEERGRRMLRTLEPDRVECEVDAGNEAMIGGVVVLWGRGV